MLHRRLALVVPTLFVVASSVATSASSLPPLDAQYGVLAVSSSPTQVERRYPSDWSTPDVRVVYIVAVIDRENMTGEGPAPTVAGWAASVRIPDGFIFLDAEVRGPGAANHAGSRSGYAEFDVTLDSPLVVSGDEPVVLAEIRVFGRVSSELIVEPSFRISGLPGLDPSAPAVPYWIDAQSCNAPGTSTCVREFFASRDLLAPDSSGGRWLLLPDVMEAQPGSTIRVPIRVNVPIPFATVEYRFTFEDVETAVSFDPSVVSLVDVHAVRSGDSIVRVDGLHGIVELQLTVDPPVDVFTYPDVVLFELEFAIDDPAGSTLVRLGDSDFVDVDGERVPADVRDGNVESAVVVAVPIAPSGVVEMSIAPNPFNPVTQVAFTGIEGQRTTVHVFDARGRRVDDLFDGITTGTREVIAWRADDLPSGVYFVRAISSGEVVTRKLTLLE